jgi:hypothetical protein
MQIDVKKQKVLRDYGEIHGNIQSIAITSDDKYIFTSCILSHLGHLRQFSVRHGKMIKNYGKIFETIGMWAIITTPDNKWLFAASSDSQLKQISLESQQVVHDYGKIHDKSFTCLETTRDSKWLFTGSWDGHVKRISV